MSTTLDNGNLPDVKMYSDGACSGNPGPGGWGFLLVWATPEGKRELEGNGGDAHTTNNRMELTGAIMGLRALKRQCRVHLMTDSQYVLKGMTEWLPGWKRRGWKNAQGKPVENRPLWEELETEVQRHKVTWEWVKGHAGHAENERVDRLAVAGVPKRSTSQPVKPVS